MINKKLNILQIINEPWTSGITEYGLNLSRGLKRNGHNVVIAGLKGTVVEDGAKKHSIKYEILNNINSLSPFNICNSIRQINDILKKENIDVINTHRAEGQSLGFISNKLTGNRAVLIRTRGDQRVTKNNFLNRYLYRSFTDRIIVASRMAKEDHFNGFDIAGKIKVIPPAVDTDIFNPRVSGEKFRINYGIKKDEYLVGIIGRLDPVKGHYYFLEAASRLKDILPDVKYAVVGQEENIKLNELKNIAGSFGLQDKVIFSGFYKNIPEAAAGFDIGVIASIGSEAISRVCLEMMACGKPVIASRVGSIPEMITDGETGLLYDPKDSETLSEHVKNLVLNPELIKKIGLGAYSKVMDKYSIDTLTKNTEDAYFEALEEKWKKLL
ncbi:MAG: glycosyltransferase family 4 protein [bacterium]|nr:glycosyltransferase family 4 protein [bacterium]